MNYKGTAPETAETSGRLWRFADYEFDELARELRVKGRPVDLESKPLEILLQLLLHAGEVVTKEELLESVWPDVMVVDGSLATAVSKLRKGDGRRRPSGDCYGSPCRLPAGRAGLLQNGSGARRAGAGIQSRGPGSGTRAMAAYSAYGNFGLE